MSSPCARKIASSSMATPLEAAREGLDAAHERQQRLEQEKRIVKDLLAQWSAEQKKKGSGHPGRRRLEKRRALESATDETRQRAAARRPRAAAAARQTERRRAERRGH